MNRKIWLIVLSLCIVFTLAACDLPGGGSKVDPGWVYEEVEGGIMITGYIGDAEEPAVPSEINGKEVLCIKAGDNYNFSSVGIYPYNCLYKGEDGNFYLNSNGGDRVIQLRGSLTAMTGFNFFFEKDILTVGNLVCDVNYKDFKLDDFVNVPWELSGSEAHPYSIALLFNKEGKVVVKDYGTEEEKEGSYTYSQGLITIDIDGETTEFMLFGDDLVCWEVNNYFARIMDEPYLTVFSLPDFNRSFLTYGSSDVYWQMTSLVDGYVSECTVKFGMSKASGEVGDNISQVTATITISHNGSNAQLFPVGTYEYKILGNRIVFGENYMYSFRIIEGDCLVDGHHNVYLMMYPEY